MGNTWTAVLQTYPPKPKFSTDQMPDLTGQVMIVTGMFTRHVVLGYVLKTINAGGNSGIGFETVKVRGFLLALSVCSEILLD